MTQLLRPDLVGEAIEVWSAFPYSTANEMYNRFFLSNFSFEHEKAMIPKMTDLNGLPVIGAFIHYPPYTAYYHVVSDQNDGLNKLEIKNNVIIS